MTETIKFQDLASFTESDVEEAISRNLVDEIPLVPVIVAIAGLNPHHAERVCTRLCSHTQKDVRAHAMLGLGHLARRFRLLDEASVLPLIESGIMDAEEYVRTAALSAADEIHQFLGWSFRGHEYGLHE